MSDPFVDAVVKALALDLPDEVRNLLVNLSNERVGYLERLRLVQRVAVGEMDNLLNLESAMLLAEDGENLSASDPAPSPPPQTAPENVSESSPNSKEEGSGDPDTPEVGD